MSLGVQAHLRNAYLQQSVRMTESQRLCLHKAGGEEALVVQLLALLTHVFVLISTGSGTLPSPFTLRILHEWIEQRQ